MRYDGDYHEKARALAEAIYEAYAQQATAPSHRLTEQNAVTRLIEAIEPMVAAAPDELVKSVNAVIDSWEAGEPELRGPRAAFLDLERATVALRPR